MIINYSLIWSQTFLVFTELLIYKQKTAQQPDHIDPEHKFPIFFLLQSYF